MLKKPKRYSSDRLFLEFPVLNVRQLYIKSVLLYIKNAKAKFFRDIEHPYITRHRINFRCRMPTINYNVEMHSTYYLAHTLYSNLPPEILAAEGGSLAQYKRALRDWLLSIGPEGAEALIRSPYA